MGSGSTNLTITDVAPDLRDVKVEIVDATILEGTTIQGPVAGQYKVRVSRTGDTQRDLDVLIRARDRSPRPPGQAAN